MNFDKEFTALFESILEPKLFSIGFKRVVLAKGWISPEYLFERDGIWFACSWDWRDRYLEINLGRLFFFKDVLPRVIVYGPFENYLMSLGDDVRNRSDHPNDNNYIFDRFNLVVKFIDRVLADFNRLYDLPQKQSSEALAKSRKGRKVRRDFLVHFGKELKREDLPIA